MESVAEPPTYLFFLCASLLDGYMVVLGLTAHPHAHVALTSLDRCGSADCTGLVRLTFDTTMTWICKLH